ncbi:MAG: 1-deoxy-D-xylulose-5-phosphate synthase [Bacteroidota bacterium]|jgi:1-deoxy-D-xylulose-5-phosphate synthase|nr:1-deoxy-D-xylulose-5-phosphate synthase [Bacteroidota bacterium]NLP21105.1 1-deoxy-D-xylulose-5-phosphate synthase [Bacteroidales bacterium]OQC46344.1 MAG: 1-deoxy-D-xylulose-5-phosphate synthase [Bacteroidetes bacterium ADurb.Bin028]HOD88415.1 1-deoxy-D-xylulose-5-phosphate synthase [Bacteroidales bacterium]
MIDDKKYQLLKDINSPDDLKKIDLSELPTVCEELRNFIIESASKNPGHFGASLGVVELTVALHYAYNTPVDQLVWDVGHQAYGHKILTGRRDLFHTNRTYGGISGFPSPKESEYDNFGVGHASTSISAALGIAKAANLQGEKINTVAIIGDGSLTGGIAFEGLNNLGASGENVLIVLNDNKIAIDENRGALKEYLTDIATSKTYNKVKDDVWYFLGRLNRLGLNVQSFSQKIDNAIKSIVLKNSNLFEALNIRYFGPVDGHDVVLLVKLFEDIKNIPGPKLLHIITKKGKGFKAAEENQTLWHAAPGKFDITTGKLTDTSHCENEPQKFQDIFGDAIIELAKANPKICAITPAMISGSSLCKMFEEFPERSFDVGISEQHAVTFAAGLAIKGMLPFCNIYSSFMQRAYDQVIHDVALQNLKVIFCLDRAGLVGQDGPTHHGSFDLSYMRCVPNLVIAAPRDEFQLRNLMFTLQLEKHNFPSVIRYPRGKSTQAKSKIEFKEIEIGKGEKIKDGKDIAILSIGTPGNTAIKLANDLEEENLNIAVFDMIFVKPLDNKLLTEIFNNYKHIITIEDNSIIGGFGSAISEFMVDNKFNSKIYRFGIPDRFISHGSQQQLIEECEFDYNTLKLFIKNLN